jgi:SNF2 family DNA or RNA helicase
MLISNKSKADMDKSITKEKKIAGLTELARLSGLPNTLNTYEAKLELLIQNAKLFTKYENMDKIFELNNDNLIKKYLIFTEYESTLNEKITNILTKWGLQYARIKGAGSMISNTVEQYKKGNINTLLINSKYFGSGMNLENTTDIIIIHKMQADVEMQVIGRAQRFGRTGNLRVWKLYYQNEVNN